MLVRLSTHACVCIQVRVHRGIVSTVSVRADTTSSWFQCIATNKLGTDKGQTEFYVSGSVCVCLGVWPSVCKSYSVVVNAHASKQAGFISIKTKYNDNDQIKIL